MRDEVLNLSTAVEKNVVHDQSILRSMVDGQREHASLPVQEDGVAVNEALFDEVDVVEEHKLGDVVHELIVAEIRKKIGLHDGDVGHVAPPWRTFTLGKLAQVSNRPPGFCTVSPCRVSYPRAADLPGLTCCSNDRTDEEEAYR